ncbi:MAG TPA: L,D-transpeptidase family protein [Allosphingosinicella sp.]|nr:L,D-transpeptidase family protein [Allosphingosinicella sp.]
MQRLPRLFALLLPLALLAAAAPVDVGPEIAAFYRERSFIPVWVTRAGLKPEGRQALRMLGAAASPELRQAVAAARDGDARRLTRADLLLSRDFAALIRDRAQPPAAAAMRYIDPDLAPGPPPLRAILDPRAPEAFARVNPAYDGLRRGLAAYRARWSRLPQAQLPPRPPEAALRHRLGGNSLAEFQHVHGLPASGRADPATIAALNRGAPYYERMILANIERARAIPARPGGRYILVDTASARLWMVESGRIVGAMRVVVGKRAMPTPAMAGMIRYAVLNPYWNLPPDLIRSRARGGARAIAAEHLQVLSDWSDQARELDPRRVDWRAVAAGRRHVNLRQTPGPHNMMGRIKFMMPNDLGVYLHDTPLRDLLARADRHASSGCVRLQDAPGLARWLFRGRLPQASGAEQQVDLPEPVPVYLAYFTALPSRDGIVFQSDVYRRDGAPRSTPRRNRITPAK